MSHKIDRILIPIDFSDASNYSLAQGTDITKQCNAELILIHVMERPNNPYASIHEASMDVLPDSELRKAVEHKMSEIIKSIQSKNGIKAKFIIRNGSIEDEICDCAKAEKADLIVMGTHGASGYKEMFLGSNAQHVINMTNVPVLTLRESKGNYPFKKILLPIDTSFHSRQKVTFAIHVAHIFSSELLILGLTNSSDNEEFQKFKVKIKAVEQLLQKENLKFSTEIEPSEDIAGKSMDYAQKHHCDLIIINTGHESNVTGTFLGAFAQRIVNHSKIPVMSIKPTKDSAFIDTIAIGV